MQPPSRGTEGDTWGVAQGLVGSSGVSCRRGFANRGNVDGEFPVTVVVMPKVCQHCVKKAQVSIARALRGVRQKRYKDEGFWACCCCVPNSAQCVKSPSENVCARLLSLEKYVAVSTRALFEDTACSSFNPVNRWLKVLHECGWQRCGRKYFIE